MMTDQELENLIANVRGYGVGFPALGPAAAKDYEAHLRARGVAIEPPGPDGYPGSGALAKYCIPQLADLKTVWFALEKHTQAIMQAERDDPAYRNLHDIVDRLEKQNRSLQRRLDESRAEANKLRAAYEDLRVLTARLATLASKVTP